MTAKDYLLNIGFDDTHLPELFNDDDKSYYKIDELMEAYHISKVKKLNTSLVSNLRGLLIDFMSKLTVNDHSKTIQQTVDIYLESINSL